MRRRLMVGLWIAGGLVALTALVLFASTREPRYHGRALSQWLAIESDSLFVKTVGNVEAEDAVRHIGTNALPYLVRWLDAENCWRTKLHDGIQRWPRPLQPHFLMQSLQHCQRHEHAVAGFFVLRSEAAPVIPQLQRLARKSKGPQHINRQFVIPCLGRLGTAARPALAELMRDPDPTVRDAARAAYFQTMPAMPDGVLPSFRER